MSKHTNRLAKETSPYLLQHAHNPVDWYPWGNEAFDLAKKTNRPMLISIGYSACHWCHVMERESFEKEETAAIMNEHFVNIKIDREERPDIDHIYMDAVQAMTGSGGWPLNVFLLPDGRPFFGGTYFPPVRAFNRGSWQETLLAVSKAYNERLHELESQAENLTQHIRASNITGVVNQRNDEGDNQFDEEIISQVLKQADVEWGGFGKAPKFPQTFTIVYLLRAFYFTKNHAALKQALLSLQKMACGGMYDHLGGGFARYSTDEKWLAPHFEKMLYDNALLITALAEAFQLSNDPLFEKTIVDTIGFISRELLLEEGGFLSALDADSEGVEGKFYTWSKTEIDEVLQADSSVFCDYYGVKEHGNWEHTNILWVTKPLREFVEQTHIEKGEEKDISWYNALLERGRQKLFETRKGRVRPQTDDKVLLSWNALMNTALCKAYAALGNEEYKNLAVKNIAFLEQKFVDKETGGWFHTYKNDVAKYPAFLEDYAYLIQAYINLQEITGDAIYLDKARNLVDFTIENFIDKEDGYFFFTHKNQTDVIIRKKEVYDGATPSGNSVMALNLLYLAKVFDNASWFQMAEKMISGIRQSIVKYPTSFANWAVALQSFAHPVHEIAIVGENYHRMLIDLLNLYIPGRIVQSSATTNNQYPLLKGKPTTESVQIYLCKDYACSAPVTNVNDLQAMLPNRIQLQS